MAALTWQDEYTVGVKELDDQHKKLLEIINYLGEQQQEEYDANKFSDTISSLIHYAYTHFATEERYLLQTTFPDIKKHVFEHIDFIMKTLSLYLRIEKGGEKDLKELLKYLKEWYASHVLGLDRNYIPFMRSKGIK
jgi:hemerythrin-like metal-binding protein